MSILSDNERNRILRKKKYYNAHPNEAIEDHAKQIQTGTDDFIMKKVEEWEKEQNKK